MMSFEEIYYETIGDLQHLRQHLANSGFSDIRPQDADELTLKVWDKAKELEDLLCSEEFEVRVG